jgi:hypothetical protein
LASTQGKIQITHVRVFVKNFKKAYSVKKLNTIDNQLIWDKLMS